MKTFKVGDQVTTTVEKAAYYSEYAGSIKQTFKPRQQGTFVCKTPAVNRNYDLYIVDFVGNNGQIWRVSLKKDQIIRAQDERGDAKCF